MNENQENESADNLQIQKAIKGRWIAGQSGNPSGRRSGSRNKASLVAQALLVGEVNAVTNKLIELAKSGDIQAIRIVFDKLIPNARDRAIRFAVPQIGNMRDLMAAISEVVNSVAGGIITPSEGHQVAGLLERLKRLVENEEFEERIGRLEAYAKTRTEG